MHMIPGHFVGVRTAVAPVRHSQTPRGSSASEDRAYKMLLPGS